MTNLVMVFDESIDIQTGNLSILKTADDSVVQTIDVTSGLVTGNGTTTITVDPSGILDYDNGYYINVDASAFDDEAGNSFAGISDNGTWSFTTGSYVAWYDWNWDYRIKITVDSSLVNGDVSNFPVYVDLSDLPDNFFTNVDANGADLRVTKADGTTEVAREIVSISTGSKTGELHFVANGTLSSSVDTDFYIYYGNPTATEPGAGTAYGKNNVWIEGYVGVWHMQEDPSGSSPQILDSSSVGSDGTSAGTMTSDDSVTARLGRGVDFDGSNDTINVGNSSLLNFERTDTYTLSAWVKPATGSTGAVFAKMNYSSVKGYDFTISDTYDFSMKMGSEKLFPQVRSAEPETIVVADGTSCRCQIADGTGRQAQHVASVLADRL